MGTGKKGKKKRERELHLKKDMEKESEQNGKELIFVGPIKRS